MNSKQLNVILGAASLLLLAVSSYLLFGKNLAKTYKECAKTCEGASSTNFNTIVGSEYSEEFNVQAYLVNKYDISTGWSGMIPFRTNEEMVNAKALAISKLINENQKLAGLIKNRFNIGNDETLADKITQFKSIELRSSDTGYFFTITEGVECGTDISKGQVTIEHNKISDKLYSKNHTSVPC